MHLRYKLFTGNTERYTELRQNVTESWGFVDMCRLDDEFANVQDDTLRLGVEISLNQPLGSDAFTFAPGGLLLMVSVSII